MNNFKNLAIALHNDEDGATATEYIILLVLIACFVIAIVALFGETIKNLFIDAQEEVGGIGIGGTTSTHGNTARPN